MMSWLKASTLASVLSIGTIFSVQAVELNAKSYMVGDTATGTIALEKDADVQMGPASLTKLMTLYLVFESLQNGSLSLDTQIPVSEKAWRMGGSKMFIEVGKTVLADDLIKGIAVVSGNDACIAASEFIGGSEEGFAVLMNEKAKDLGMMNTNFVNASGWPDDNQYTTAKDMFTLAKRIQADFPQFYHYFSIPSFEYSGIKQANRNGLLSRGIGVDGLKTGHIEEAGYHLISSARQGDERLISVVLGTDSMAQRESESQKGLVYVFRTFDLRDMVRAGDVMQKDVPVWHSVEGTLKVVAKDTLTTYIGARDADGLKAKLEINEGLVAPIKAGDTVGQLTFVHPADSRMFSVDVVAQHDVARKGFFGRLWDSFLSWLGIINGPK
ncbi:MAG: D-alanyl-D-alanine carboxypeptidase [Alphaproteobacteria bacterium]|nr:D-alanyl-D-alanine carboxypeptidase [Alphaproteobacteria bacterium]